MCATPSVIALGLGECPTSRLGCGGDREARLGGELGLLASRTRTVTFAACGSLGVFQVNTPVSGSIAAPLGPSTISYFTGRARCRSTNQVPSPSPYGDFVRSSIQRTP